MNQKLNNKEISIKDYIEWKLNIDVFELEKNRNNEKRSKEEKVNKMITIIWSSLTTY